MLVGQIPHETIQICPGTSGVWIRGKQGDNDPDGEKDNGADVGNDGAGNDTSYIRMAPYRNKAGLESGVL
jgi:hypothetical protein